jgi:hypothetical protein
MTEMKGLLPFSFTDSKPTVAALTQGPRGSDMAGPYHLSTGFERSRFLVAVRRSQQRGII